MPGPRELLLEFVYLDLFERTARGMLTEEDLVALELRLIADPRAGVLERHCGGVRKTRVGRRGMGRRGGARVVYLYVERRARVYLLLAFPKSQQAAMSPEERRTVRALAERIRRE
jgi:hypothetical protein